MADLAFLTAVLLSYPTAAFLKLKESGKFFLIDAKNRQEQY